MATATQSYVDRSREMSRSEFSVGPMIEPVGGDPQYDTLVTRANNIQTAIAAITLCNFTNLVISEVVEADLPVTPTSANAQREIALWVQGADGGGNFHSFTIPGPDLTLVAQANTDEVDIVSNVAAAALKTVLNANWKTDEDTAITVTRMRIRGRAS